jgi:acetyl esterase
VPFDPYYTRLFDQLAGVDLERLHEPRIADDVLRIVEASQPRWTMPDVVVADRSIPGPGGAIHVRVYRPPTSVRSVLLWAHGGGFTGGGLDIRESAMVCAELAARADCAAIGVGYRLAVGGVRYPAPLDDVHAAWRWALGEWPDLPAVIGGASAGAALAMATAGRDRMAGVGTAGAMLLAYPLVHAQPPPATGYWAEAIADLPAPARLPAGYIAGIVRDYVGEGVVPQEAFPGAGRLEALPPTAIVVPEYDGLRAAAALLEEQLLAAGVPVRSFIARGALHGHLNLSPSLTGVEASLEFMADVVRAPQRLGGRP